MSKHNHIESNNTCEHDLKHCKKCDKVECSKCLIEWERPIVGHNPLNVPYIPQIPGQAWPNTIWCNNPAQFQTNNPLHPFPHNTF